MKNAKHLKTRKCFTNVGSSKMDSMYRVTVQRNEDEGLKKRQLQMPGNSFTLFVQQKGREDIELKFYSPEEYNKMLTFEGVIETKSQVKPRTTSAKFECPSCGHIITVLQLDTVLLSATKCGCGRKGKFRLISKELINAFTIKLQELPENVNYDPELQGISVLFKDDLTEQEIEEKVYQGIRIKVTGILHEVEIHKQGDKKSIDVDFLLEANYIEFTENEFFDYKISDEEMKEINKIAKDPNAVKILSEEMGGENIWLSYC